MSSAEFTGHLAEVRSLLQNTIKTVIQLSWVHCFTYYGNHEKDDVVLLVLKMPGLNHMISTCCPGFIWLRYSIVLPLLLSPRSRFDVGSRVQLAGHYKVLSQVWCYVEPWVVFDLFTLLSLLTLEY